MSETSEALPVIQAHRLLKLLCSCPGIVDHFQTQGAESSDLSFVQSLLDDKSLVFFSIQKVIDRQIAKSVKAKKYIPDGNQDTVLASIKGVL